MKRLLCSAVFVLSGLAAHAALGQVDTGGGWRYYEQIDPFTDLDTSRALVEDEGLSGALALRCNGAEVDVLVLFQDYFAGRDDRVAIQYRFDSGDPVQTLRIPTIMNASSGHREHRFR